MGDIPRFAAHGEPFRFMLDDDRVWELPAANRVPTRILAAVTGGMDPQKVVDVLDGLCPGLADVASVGQVSEVITAWAEAAGMTPGES